MGVLQKCHISLNNQRFQCWTLCDKVLIPECKTKVTCGQRERRKLLQESDKLVVSTDVIKVGVQ